ncbi:MAG: hypothetical protein WA749_00690 [Gelidibacter sp.]
MDPRFFTLREVDLNNNCPECYSQDGLQFTFKQRFIENSFYKAISNETSHSLCCNTCKTMIFPVRWTDDIERVFDYHQRATPPKPTSLKLKTLSWILIAVLVGIAITSTVLILEVF